MSEEGVTVGNTDGLRRSERLCPPSSTVVLTQTLQCLLDCSNITSSVTSSSGCYQSNNYTINCSFS